MKGRPRRTFLGLLAAGGVGLVTSVFFSALSLNRLELGFANTLYGLLPLLIGCVVIGLPTMWLLERYHYSAIGTFIVAIGVACVVVIATVATGYFLGYINILFCAAAAAVLTSVLSQHKKLSIGILVGATAIAAFGAVTLAVPDLLPPPQPAIRFQETPPPDGGRSHTSHTPFLTPLPTTDPRYRSR